MPIPPKATQKLISSAEFYYATKTQSCRSETLRTFAVIVESIVAVTEDERDWGEYDFIVSLNL